MTDASSDRSCPPNRPGIRPGRPIRRATVFLALIALGCSDAVTDLSRAGFDADPVVIEGHWATLITTGTHTQRFDAQLTPAGGVFLGRFDLLYNGEVIHLFFSEGVWDGTTLEFRAKTPVGGTSIDLNWTARFEAADGELPDRLLLLSDLFIAPIQYVRPNQLP